MKVCINTCYGGFSVSEAVYKELGLNWDGFGYLSRTEIKRNNPRLIAAVEKLGSKAASGSHADLKVVEVPDEVDWYIEEYDGLEHVAEKHRTWK